MYSEAPNVSNMKVMERSRVVERAPLSEVMRNGWRCSDLRRCAVVVEGGTVGACPTRHCVDD